MSNSVCLTDRQQKFYNYIINFYKSNGCFPNASQSARDLKWNVGVVTAAYGTLLLKGVFSNGQPLTVTYKARHSTTPVQSLNLANFKMDPKPAPVKKAAAKKPAKNKIDKQKIALALIKLLSGEDAQKELLSLNDAEDNKMFDLFRQLAG